MKNIKLLVPLDFSDLSTGALQAAQTVAKIFDGSITPFHAYLPISEMDGPYMLGLGPAPMEDYEEMESILKNRIRELSDKHVDQTYLKGPVISVGNPAQAIVDESENYDMIVMSTHGRTGFTRFFLGSVTEKVLRLSHIPVLVIEKGCELSSLKRILVTTDFSENSHSAFPYAREIAEAADAEVELLNILNYDPHHDDEPDEGKISMRKQRLDILSKEELHDIGDRLKTNVVVSTETAHEAILNYDLNNPHDLIIMATVGRTGIDYLMVGSTTANLIRHVKTPVLSINPKIKKVEMNET